MERVPALLSALNTHMIADSTNTTPRGIPLTGISGRRREWVREHARCWLANPIGLMLLSSSSSEGDGGNGGGVSRYILPGAISPMKIVRARWRAGADGGAVVRGCTVGSVMSPVAGGVGGWVIPVGDRWRLVTESTSSAEREVLGDMGLIDPVIGATVSIIRAPRFVVVRSRVHMSRADSDEILTLGELVDLFS
jgi:hypothetical protein